MPNFVPDSGPITAQTLIIGEAPGREENNRRRPFLGRAGMRLTEFTKAAKIDRIKELRITNTYPMQPPNNNLSLIPQHEREQHLQTLYTLIRKMPNLRLIVPMGAYALNAVLPDRPSTITNLRGSIYPRGKHLILPMVHPALTLYEDSWTRAAHHDWKRARLLMDNPGAYKPVTRDHEIMPSLSRVKEYLRECQSLGKKDCLAIDIETPVKTGRQLIGYYKNGKPKWQKTKGARFIACIGFSFSKYHSLTVPLTRSYWGRDVGDAWDLVEEICKTNVDKVFHNGMFDTWHLDRVGIWVRNWKWDTKDLHHALDPWDKHSLGYCASVDTWEPYWKCLKGSTEVLTQGGWRRLDQLTGTTTIMQYDEGRLCWADAVPRKKRFDGRGIRITNTRHDAWYTPEHKVITAIGDKIEVQQMRKLDGLTVAGLYDHEHKYLLTEDEIRLLAAIQADGAVRVKSRTPTVQFCLKRPRKIKRFLALCRRVDCRLSEYPAGRAKHGRLECQVTGESVNRCLSLLGQKKVFGSWLLGFGDAELDVLLQEIRYWDGWKTYNGNAINYSSKHKENVEWIATIAHLRGRAANVQAIEGGKYWKVSIKDRLSITTRSRHFSQESFSGLVYCVTVPSGAFLARANGKIFVTGNSEGKNEDQGVPLDLERWWRYCGKDAAVTRELQHKYRVRLSKIEIREPQAQDWWEASAA